MVAQWLLECFSALSCSLNIMLRVQVTVVIGGLDMQTQSKALAERPHIVIATPGRLRVRQSSSCSEQFSRRLLPACAYLNLLSFDNNYLDTCSTTR